MKTHKQSANPSRRLGARRVGALSFLCLSVSVFSLLIWAKLRVVTGIPRTAYAEPEAAAHRQAKAPTPAAPEKAAHPQTE